MSELEDKTRFPDLSRRLRCLAIGGGKGGVGKTVVSVGVATVLSERGYKVLLFDADLGLANVDIQIGVNTVFTLQDVVYGDCPLERAVIAVPDGPDVLASSSGTREMTTMSDGRRKMLADDLVAFSAAYDFLIVDTEAGIGPGAISFLRAMPEVCIVVANEPTSVMDAYSIIKILREKSGAPVPGLQLVVNMVKTMEEGRVLAERLNGITEKFLGFRLPVAGTILHDYVVGDAIRARRSVVQYAPNSAPAASLRELAAFLSDPNRFREGERRADLVPLNTLSASVRRKKKTGELHERCTR